MTQSRLFCFGLGYTAEALARRLVGEGWQAAGTCRDEKRQTELRAVGIEAWLFDRDRPLEELDRCLAGTTHLLSSVPPDDAGDPVIDVHGPALARLAGLA